MFYICANNVRMKQINNSNEKFTQLLKRYETDLSGRYFDAEEIEEIAEFYLRRMRIKEAKRAIEFGLKLHPSNLFLEVCRVRIFIELSDFGSALQAITRLSAENEFDFDILLLKGEILLKSGREDEAKETFQILLDNAEGDVDETYLDIAYVYLGAQKYQKALDILLLGYLKNNENQTILSEIAFCYEQLDEIEKAIYTYEKILNINPYSNEAWFNLGQVYFSQGNFPKAIEAYEFATTIDEDDAIAWQLKAHSYYQNDNYKKAAESYLIYAEKSEHKESPTLFAAECYEKMEDYDMAIHYYSIVLETQPKNAEALVGMGICFSEKESFQDSINYFLEALKIEPDASETWVYLGEAYINSDKTEEGLTAYLKATELDDNQPETYVSIGNLYLEKTDYQLALDYYLRAFEQDNSAENIKLLIAMAYFGLEDYQLAQSYLEEAITLNSESVNLFLEVFPDALKKLTIN